MPNEELYLDISLRKIAKTLSLKLLKKFYQKCFAEKRKPVLKEALSFIKRTCTKKKIKLAMKNVHQFLHTSK